MIKKGSLQKANWPCLFNIMPATRLSFSCFPTCGSCNHISVYHVSASVPGVIPAGHKFFLRTTFTLSMFKVCFLESPFVQRCIMSSSVGCVGQIYLHARKALARYFREQFTWGCLLGRQNWPQYAQAASPELVRHVTASCVPTRLAAPPRFLRHVSAIVRLVSALISYWPRLQTLFAMCPPSYSPCVRRVSAWRPPGVRTGHVSTLCQPGP